MPDNHLAGYDELIHRYKLEVIPHWHHSSINISGGLKSYAELGQLHDAFPASYQPDDSLGGQLEFALKYDGVNLGILSALFAIIDPAELTAHVQATPTGKYARRLWYLYELLSRQRLPLPDVTTGNYVNLLEADQYYTAVPVPARRQRVNDNLLGDTDFCPMVRRTRSSS